MLAPLLPVLLLLGCGNGDDDDPQAASSGGTLVHTWEYVNSTGNAGDGLTLASDGTYVQDSIRLTSSASADVEEVKGSYTVAGNTLTLSPEEGTCTGADPAQQLTFALTDTTLTISYPQAIIVYQVDTASPTSIAITLGCFDASGDFTALPLTPISASDAGR